MHDSRSLTGSRKWLGLATLVALTATIACGKSTRTRDTDDPGGSPGSGGDTPGSGGVSGRGGSGGNAGQGGVGKGGGPPGMEVDLLSTRATIKVDLLFMVDNSISMADKQTLLAEAVPVLVSRLIDPICVTPDGTPAGAQPCGSGSAPEYNAIEDLHIGVISSSLGNHGGDVCTPQPDDASLGRTPNDAAQLLPTINNTVSGRQGLYSWNNSGFLVWDPRDSTAPGVHAGRTPAEQDPSTFVANFANHVIGAGELGCGYEASLEAWYRFLIDPEPVANVGNDGTFSLRDIPNQAVLAQRAAFLRPDSLLGIVMLSDENDCSIIDEDVNNALGYSPQGWLVGRVSARMPRASDGCLHPEDPNQARCCRPCVIPAAEGCPGDTVDPQCSLGGTLTIQEDSTNLRCFKQRQRFGIDLLYDVQRYVDGLTLPFVANRAGQEVPNPIFQAGADGTPSRDPSMVFLAGIVGVPWQDIASDDSLTGSSLTYLTAQELQDSGRWEVILGNPSAGVQPLDPLMIEQVDPRPTGAVHPILGVAAAVASASSTNQQANPINGHEQNVVGRDDLQYACIFPLNPPKACTMANQDSCDCNASEADYNRPLCAYADGTSNDGEQNYVKAYPSLRQLEVLRGLGENGVVASVCAKNVVSNDPVSDPSYGYNPAVSAIVRQARQSLGARCFPRQLEPDAAGRVPCRVVEASTVDCACDAPGRSELDDPETIAAVLSRLSEFGICGHPGTPGCSEYCLCELEQLSGAALDECQNNVSAAENLYGFCYVDPGAGTGAPEIVQGCPTSSRRLLRFLGDDVPAAGRLALLACDVD